MILPELIRTVGIHADGKWVQFLGDDPQTQSRSSQPPCMVPRVNLETMMISLLFTENLGQIWIWVARLKILWFERAQVKYLAIFPLSKNRAEVYQSDPQPSISGEITLKKLPWTDEIATKGVKWVLPSSTSTTVVQDWFYHYPRLWYRINSNDV